MGTVETNNLHFGWYENFDPASSATVAPLSFLDLAFAIVQEADSKDVALAFLLAQEHFNSADLLLRPNLVELRIYSRSIHRVDCFTLNIACKDKLKLVQVRVCLDAKSSEFDALSQVHRLQVGVLRPRELASRSRSGF